MVVNGWSLYAYPLFDQQLTALEEKIKAARRANAAANGSHPAEKLLATTLKQVHTMIPANPNAPQFRQGNTLGRQNRQWFRAKFHLRYRLFFRFSTAEKAIVYAWMNDESTLRKSGSRTDPYTVFESMIDAGDPPGSFEQLLERSRAF